MLAAIANMFSFMMPTTARTHAGQPIGNNFVSLHPTFHVLDWEKAEPILAEMIAVACKEYCTGMRLGWDVSWNLLSEEDWPQESPAPNKVHFEMCQIDGNFEAISPIMYTLLEGRAAAIHDIELLGSTAELARCKDSPLIRALDGFSYIEQFDLHNHTSRHLHKYRHEAQERVGFTKFWERSGGRNNGGNDFELVVRMTKELEYILETHFGAPNRSHVGLAAKINQARTPDGAKLSESVKERMLEIVKTRNDLVHVRSFNKIPDRGIFLAAWSEVQEEFNKWDDFYEDIRWTRILSDSKYSSHPFALNPWAYEVVQTVLDVEL
jgi:hypothetical protein